MTRRTARILQLVGGWTMIGASALSLLSQPTGQGWSEAQPPHVNMGRGLLWVGLILVGIGAVLEPKLVRTKTVLSVIGAAMALVSFVLG